LRGHAAHERSVVVYSREGDEYVPGRLVAMRLPAAEAEKARVRVRRDLGTKASSLDFEAAQYVVLGTLRNSVYGVSSPVTNGERHVRRRNHREKAGRGWVGRFPT